MPFIEQQLTADGVVTEGRHIVTEALYEIITNDYIASLNAVAVGGTGYAVGDTFRLDVGTPVQVNGDDFHATGRVTAESGGVVTAIEIISSGAYTAVPVGGGSPVTEVSAQATVTLTGSGDDALTVDLSTTIALWTSDEFNIDSPFTQNEWLVSSTKAANAPTIGARSQLSGGNDSLRFTIGSSYSNSLPWDGQPGVPPTMTFYIGVPNQNPKIYVSTTERRVNMLVTDGTSKQYVGAGLFIPFVDVSSNYPFPAVIHAQSTVVRSHIEVFSTSNRGIVNPINFGGVGCYQYRDNLSSGWFGITEDNNNGVDVSRAQIWPNKSIFADYSLTYAPVPTGSLAPAGNMLPGTASAPNMAYQENLWFGSDQVASVGPAGPQPLGIGNQLHFTVQAHIISNQVGDVQMIGFIDGFEAVHGRGLTSFDEIQNQDGRRYIVFPDTQSGDLTNWVAMEMI